MSFVSRAAIYFWSALAMASMSVICYAEDGHHRKDTSRLLLDVASAYLLNQATFHLASDRPRRDRAYARPSSNYNNFYRSSYRNHGLGGRYSNRHNYAGASYTSEPIRGGSKRRTRVIDNPYPNRPITGITFTGIDDDAVHIKDVISYPRKRLLSPRGYSLSLHHPDRFFNTRGYVNYISVKAKRREYFTVTFHYD